jgi:hypothetical protein
MLRVGGVPNVVRAASAEDDEDQTIRFNISNSMYGPSIASTRDSRSARLLLRLVTDEHGHTQPTVMGVVKTAFSFDGLADYYFEGSFLMRERLFPAADRRDFLNSDLEPLVLRPNWSLAGSDRVADFNMSGAATRGVKDVGGGGGVVGGGAAGAVGGGDASGNSQGVFRVSATAPAPQPPVMERDVVASKVYIELEAMFRDRPVWHPQSLQAKMAPELYNTPMYSAALRCVAYGFVGGPFRRSLVRFGYDPRKDRNAARYQAIDLRYVQESNERMQSYASRIREYEDAWLQDKEKEILQMIAAQQGVRLASSVDPGAQAEAKLVAQVSGVSAERLKKAEATRRTYVTQSRRELQKKMMFEQVTFVQAPTRSFTMVPLDDLIPVDPVVRDALLRNKAPSTLNDKLGWLESSTYDEIQKHLKARAEYIMGRAIGEVTEPVVAAAAAATSSAAAASTSKRKRDAKDADGTAVSTTNATFSTGPVPNNYEVELKVVDSKSEAPSEGDAKKRRTIAESKEQEFVDANSE